MRFEGKRPRPAIRSEVDLYAPVKAFLEGQGYEVKGEVRGCDLVAIRGDEPPVVVELKLRFNLALVLQGIDRLSLSDTVYLAIPAAGRRSKAPSADHAAVRKLCRMLGLGLMAVHPSRAAARQVEVVLDPAPYRPRKNRTRTALLLGEYARRIGDPNRGGSAGVPIVTAYRQEALRCAWLLREGPKSLAELRRTGLVPNAARILRRDVYGWFGRVGRGVYSLSAAGRKGLETYADAIDLSAQPGTIGQGDIAGDEATKSGESWAVN